MSYHFWGTNFESYDFSTQKVESFHKKLDYFKQKVNCIPDVWVSFFTVCHNHSLEDMTNCLRSIQHQEGDFGINLIWVNDGSSSEHAAIQIRFLKRLEKHSWNIRVYYLENNTQKGWWKSLQDHFHKIPFEYVFRLNVDEIMVSNRVEIQKQFMINHNLQISGGQVEIPESLVKINPVPLETKWSDFKTVEIIDSTFLNTSTLCFLKTNTKTWQWKENEEQQMIHLLQTFQKIQNM